MDGRTVYQTDDGALLYITFGGYYYPTELRDTGVTGQSSMPTEPYFVLTLTCETADPRYAWLTKRVMFGMGDGNEGRVRFRVFGVK
jgi:hypothetical protein